MDMTSLSLLETQSANLVASIRSLVVHCQSQGISGEFQETSTTFSSSGGLTDVYRMRKTILDQLANIQSSLQTPPDFLRQLATQNQLLACLRWLGDFQVLAFIPLIGSVATRDVADLSGTPEAQLTRVIHMMSTAGFLQQPQPGHVGHTALSTSFVKNPSLLDASLFLSETAGPSALQMSAATQRFGMSDRMDETAYNIAFSDPAAFANVYMQRPRLQRQWRAYLRYAGGDFETDLLDVLCRYNWDSLDNATVVEVGSITTATAVALAAVHPALQFVVQMSNPLVNHHQWDPAKYIQSTRSGSSITIQQRAPGALQTVVDAAVYVIHLHIASLAAPSAEVPGRIVAELRANIGVLRSNRRASLLLVTSPLLRVDGGPDVQATARLRDLTQWQLTNGRGMDIDELFELLSGMADSMGRLIVVNRYSAPNNSLLVFEVRYQLHAER
ncbi:hypothetical protein F5Y16DRAFT_406384 [Xylariaceae sp. FL0255]|nr:hypothetical protein F5Y16DRAFT_406384 [Xylariaceae sp. FL0255]